jgi:hypothetical protein
MTAVRPADITLDTLIHDLTFTLRGLRRNATFAASVVVTLAIGIGTAAATMRDGDRVLSPNMAVVSDNFFTTLGMRAALGRTLMASDDVVGGDRELTYPRPVVYVAWAQQTDKPPLSFVVVRGTAGHTLAARDVDRIAREIEPRVLVTRVATMRQRLTTSLARPRFDAVVLGLLAAVALVLAAVGVYGVIAALVRQRTQEIGGNAHVRRGALRRASDGPGDDGGGVAVAAGGRRGGVLAPGASGYASRPAHGVERRVIGPSPRSPLLRGGT